MTKRISEEMSNLIAACQSQRPLDVRDAFAAAIAPKIADRVEQMRNSVEDAFFGQTVDPSEIDESSNEETKVTTHSDPEGLGHYVQYKTGGKIHTVNYEPENKRFIIQDGGEDAMGGDVFMAKHAKHILPALRKLGHNINPAHDLDHANRIHQYTKRSVDEEQLDEISRQTLANLAEGLKQKSYPELCQMHRDEHQYGGGSDKSYDKMERIEKHVEKHFGKKAKDRMIKKTQDHALNTFDMPHSTGK